MHYEKLDGVAANANERLKSTLNFAFKKAA